MKMKFNIKFIQNKKIFFIITAVILVAGLLSMILRGFYWDVDFRGGTEITYTINSDKSTSELLKEVEDTARGALEEIGSDRNLINIVRSAGDGIVIRSLELSKTEIAAIDTALKLHFEDPVAPAYTMEELKEEFAALTEPETATDEDSVADETATEDETAAETEADETEAAETEADETEAAETEAAETEAAETEAAETEADETEATETEATETEEPEVTADELVVRTGVDSVGESVSKDLRSSAIISTVIAVALMLLYITIRFQFSSALAAVCCLCHDIFIVLAAYSIFQIPVSSNIIAVILTILGYSINATIIVFDRVRENVKLMQNDSFEDKVNTSVNQTLMRSINTTITTLLTIGLIYILGVQTIKEFALPLIIGILAGLYSSVCLAGSLWTIFKGKNTKVK